MTPPDRFEMGRPDPAPLPEAPPGEGPSSLSEPVPPRPSFGDNLLLVLLAAAAVGIVLVGMRSNVYDLDRYAVPKAAVLHAVALLSLLVMLPRWRAIRLSRVDAVLAAFVAWTGVSALLARNHWLALSGFGITFSGFIVYLAARRLARTHASGLVAALAFAGALGSALGVAQAYGADWSFLGTTRPPGGTFGNRNFLAHLTAIVAPMLLLVRVRARRSGPALVAAIGLTVAAAAIVLTRSRAAWLALVAALLAMLIGSAIGWRSIRLGAERPKRRLRGAVFALALGAAAAVALPNQLDWRAANPYAQTLTRLTDYRGGSGRGRLVQYRNSVKMLKYDPLFGVGPGNWFVHYPRVTTPGDPAFDPGDPIPTNPWPSSDWVTFFVERGPVGALLLLATLIAAALACFGALRSGERDRALAAVALLGTLAAAFVAGLFDAVLLLAAPTFFVFAAAGALLPPMEKPAVDRPLRGGRRALASLTALVLALGIAAQSGGQLYALILTQDSTSRRTVNEALTYDPGDYRLQLMMMRRGSCSARIRYARAAAELLPYHSAPRRALRECGAR